MKVLFVRHGKDDDRCRNENGSILVVTHGGVIDIIYHLVKGIEWKNKGRVFKAANCSIHILNMDTMKFEIENRIYQQLQIQRRD